MSIQEQSPAIFRCSPAHYPALQNALAQTSSRKDTLPAQCQCPSSVPSRIAEIQSTCIYWLEGASQRYLDSGLFQPNHLQQFTYDAGPGFPLTLTNKSRNQEEYAAEFIYKYLSKSKTDLCSRNYIFHDVIATWHPAATPTFDRPVSTHGSYGTCPQNQCFRMMFSVKKTTWCLIMFNAAYQPKHTERQPSKTFCNN